MTDQQELSCPNCGARVYATDSQCLSCGVRLEPRAQPRAVARRAEAHYEQRARPSFRRVLVVAAVIAGACARCLFLFLPRRTSAYL